MAKKVILLCGLIGAGKTTYARTHFDYFTDLDFMHPYSRKIDQIRWTFRVLEKTEDVCHITCFPTKEEMIAFRKCNTELWWINASFNQSLSNILIRNRARDMQNLGRVIEANKRYSQLFARYLSEFKTIEVYGGTHD